MKSKLIRNLDIILAITVALSSLVSCKKSEMEVAANKQYEAKVAELKAAYHQDIAEVEGNRKIALTLAQVAELKAKADAEAKKIGLSAVTNVEAAKAESQKVEQKVAAAIPAPAPPAAAVVPPVKLTPPAPAPKIDLTVVAPVAQ